MAKHEKSSSTKDLVADLFILAAVIVAGLIAWDVCSGQDCLSEAGELGKILMHID